MGRRLFASALAVVTIAMVLGLGMTLSAGAERATPAVLAAVAQFYDYDGVTASERREALSHRDTAADQGVLRWVLETGTVAQQYDDLVNLARASVRLAGYRSAPRAIGPAGNPAAFPGLTSSTRSLQHTYSRHAADFGFTGNWNRAAGALFEKGLQSHVAAPGTLRIPGTYRGTSVIHNVDPYTGLNVIQSPTGGLVSGWQLNLQQLWNVLNRGSL